MGPKAVALLLVAILRADPAATLSVDDRVVMASKIYRLVSVSFPDLSQQQFDTAYASYVGRILKLGDRREFDLATMEFIADLHDGHTWFYDNWLDHTYGQPVGFTAYPLEGKWTVIRSALDAVKAGDVIVAIDGTPMKDFYERHRKYVSASSDRDAGLSFFDTPALFPNRFTLTL